MSAEVTIDHLTPEQTLITVREGKGGVLAFLFFVIGLAIALYRLMPAVQAAPGPLVVLVVVALGWAGLALSAQEECIVDRGTRTVRVRYPSLLGRREDQVSADEIAAVRLGLGGPDDNRRLVELVGTGGEVRLRLPRRANSFTANDQTTVGRLLAELLSVTVQSR